jgi:hypothetical protein
MMLRRVAARLRSSQWFLLLGAALAGCGPAAPSLGEPLEVKGSVTMDAAPAANVEVTFLRIEGEAAPEQRQFIAMTDASGNFTMPKVFPGDYQVMVADPVERKKAEEMMAAEDTSKYKNYAAASPLTAKVAKDSTEFKFDLTSQ